MNRAILVKTCRKNRQRWRACESTWVHELRTEGILVAAVLAGELGDFAGPGLRWIHTATGDDYGDNSLKLKHALRTLLRRADTEFVFICDDDTFIHPQRWLAHEPAAEFECRLHYPTSRREKRINKGQPWAEGGAGWWMSRRVCELYVDEVAARRSCDDVLATRTAQRHGIAISDRPDLYSDARYGAPSWCASQEDNQAITCHPVEPAEMVELWKAGQTVTTNGL